MTARSRTPSSGRSSTLPIDLTTGTSDDTTGINFSSGLVLDGFTSIIDLAFEPDARLNVEQLDDAGWLALEINEGSVEGGSVQACDVATKACSTVALGVPILTSIAYRGSALSGAIWALVPAAAPPPCSADVVPLIPTFAP